MRAAGFAAADTLIVGGGFGVQMEPDAKDQTIDIAGTLDAVARVVPSGIHVEIEPGRALIAAAGTSLYRVVAVKRFEGRRFVIVDGSLADNPRPVMYGAYHHFEAVEPRTPLAPALVCGRSCEADELGEAMLPEDLRAGDLVVMHTTGAYTYSMASNYNLVPATAGHRRRRREAADLGEPRDALERKLGRHAPHKCGRRNRLAQRLRCVPRLRTS